VSSIFSKFFARAGTSHSRFAKLPEPDSGGHPPGTSPWGRVYARRERCVEVPHLPHDLFGSLQIRLGFEAGGDQGDIGVGAFREFVERPGIAVESKGVDGLSCGPTDEAAEGMVLGNRFRRVIRLRSTGGCVKSLSAVGSSLERSSGSAGKRRSSWVA
jgi:hypothetical protein